MRRVRTVASLAVVVPATVFAVVSLMVALDALKKVH